MRDQTKAELMECCKEDLVDSFIEMRDSIHAHNARLAPTYACFNSESPKPKTPEQALRVLAKWFSLHPDGDDYLVRDLINFADELADKGGIQ